MFVILSTTGGVWLFHTQVYVYIVFVDNWGVGLFHTHVYIVFVDNWGIGLFHTHVYQCTNLSKNTNWTCGPADQIIDWTTKFRE